MTEEEQPSTTEAKKVLIVEDDKQALLVLSQMVQTAGYAVITAGDSAEAIQAFELGKPELLLVDINLRGENIGQPLDGLGLIDWLKYRHADHPFKYIIVSAEDPQMHETRPTFTGAFSFIRKPIDAELILAEIRRAVEEFQDPPETTNPEPQG
jgi:DNA-binding NtrC family response regulator